MGVARAAFRVAAEAVAITASAVPVLETPLRAVGALVWEWPGAGRFYRSVAGRYTDRLRKSGRRFRTVRVGDTPVIVDVTEFTTADLFFGNRAYEPVTTEYLLRRLPVGGVFVDIGANHGYFTLLAGARVGERGRVIAFEPNPPVFQQMVTHVEMNGFTDRVVLLQQALADRPDDRVPLFVSQCSTNSGLSTLVRDRARDESGSVSPRHAVDVRTETFDRWFEASGLAHVDVVMIDTEGSEDHVIDGMAASLQSHRVGTIICETHWETSAHRALCAAGYVPHSLDVAGPVTNIAYVPAD